MSAIFSSLKWWGLYTIAALLLGWLWGLYQYHQGVLSVRKVEVQVQLDTSLRSGKVTQDVVTVYIPRIQTVYTKGNDIIRKVPIYVPQIANDQCTINNGFVSLWNATNQMRFPNTTAGTDASASQVKLTDVAAQHAREATICTATEEQLEGLQKWVLGQQQAYK